MLPKEKVNWKWKHEDENNADQYPQWWKSNLLRTPATFIWKQNGPVLFWGHVNRQRKNDQQPPWNDGVHKDQQKYESEQAEK